MGIRVLTAFSKKYSDDNEQLMDEDMALSISVSIMMLNTDMYNQHG